MPFLGAYCLDQGRLEGHTCGSAAHLAGAVGVCTKSRVLPRFLSQLGTFRRIRYPRENRLLLLSVHETGSHAV